MIPTNVEQRLGRHTWLLLLAKKTTTSIGLLLLAVILGSAKDFIGQGLSGIFSFVAKDTVTASHVISSSVSFIAVVILVIAVIMFIIGYTIARMHFRNYTFTLEEFGLKLKKGIFDIKEVSIPYRQIQSVDVARTVAYQMFGVSRLIIMTAGDDDAKQKGGAENDTIFDPIDADIAEEIRVMLQRRIGVQVVESDTRADMETANPVSKS